MAAILGPVSILFNAAALVAGQFSPPFQDQIQGQDPVTGAASALDIVTIDATLEEVHSFNSEVTEHPVESGADITDHVRPKPIELRLRCIVSNTPLAQTPLDAAVNAASLFGLASSALSVVGLLAKAQLTKRAYETLRYLSETGSPCIVYTPYRNYASMVMISLEITRDQKTGDALSFSVGFRQITTVESATATVTAPAFAQSGLNMGQVSGTGASSAVKAQTDLLLSGGNANPINRLPSSAGFSPSSIGRSMPTITIPTRTDGIQNYSLRMPLGAILFDLTFSWNARDSSWYLLIEDSSGNQLLSKRITVGTKLLWRYTDPSLPYGEILAIDTSGQDLDPGLTDLGARVLLTFTDAADITAA